MKTIDIWKKIKIALHAFCIGMLFEYLVRVQFEWGVVFIISCLVVLLVFRISE